MDQKEFRKEFPSGWMELTRYDTLVLVIDAMLEAPESREFTTGEISTKSGASERSIKDHIDVLVELGILDELREGRDEPRYTINNDSLITKKLYDLNITVQQVKEGSLPETISHTVDEKNTNTAKAATGSKYNVPGGTPSAVAKGKGRGYSLTNPATL
jgi:DNA-binding transcriptional ArsR family regulator